MESQNELTNRYLVPQTFNSSDIIIIDDDKDETLAPKINKTDNFRQPSTTDAIIIIDDDENETLEPKINKTDNLRQSASTTDAIIILDDKEEEEETLEPKKKEQILESWWDDVNAFNELSCVLKGSGKAKDDNYAESSHHGNLVDLNKEDESVGKSSNKGNGHVSLEDLGVKVEDLKSLPWEAFDPTWEIKSETMDPWLGGYVRDMSDPLIDSNS